MKISVSQRELKNINPKRNLDHEPGGSMRDEEVIAAADEHDMAMVFTGMRHFLH